MTARRVLFAWLLATALALPGPATAGGMVVSSFTDPAALKALREVLPHLTNKVLVAEFLDRGDTDLGKGLAFLLWGEMLTAVSDQAGVGAVVARLPDQQRLVAVEQGTYHEAVADLARGQNTWLALWGLVEVRGDAAFVTTYLSVLPEVQQARPLFQVQGAEGPAVAWTARMPQTLYPFRLVRVPLEQLFHRAVVTRRHVTVRAAPSADAAVIEELGPGVALTMTDMHGTWLEVNTPSGRHGHVHMEENRPVELPPPTVAVYRRSINVRETPNGALLTRTDLDGEFRVLDRRYLPGSGLWYRLDLGGRTGWIAAFLAEERFLLPAVDFTAGVLRFQAGNFTGARTHFRRFVHRYPDERNVTLAAAHQYLGASYLNARHPEPEAAIDALSAAVRITPFSSDALKTRAVANVGLAMTEDRPPIPVLEAAPTAAVADLRDAIRLNPYDPQAWAMVDTLDAAAAGAGDVKLRRAVAADPSPLRDQLREIHHLAPTTLVPGATGRPTVFPTPRLAPTTDGMAPAPTRLTPNPAVMPRIPTDNPEPAQDE
jgi:tetratricopeptide (TPR) repeat protein